MHISFFEFILYISKVELIFLKKCGVPNIVSKILHFNIMLQHIIYKCFGFMSDAEFIERGQNILLLHM